MNHQEEEFDLRRISKIFTRHYWVFLLCVLLSLVIAFLYNKYSPKKFDVVASILINEDDNSPLSGAQEFMVNDLVNLAKYNIYLKLMIDGVSSRAFCTMHSAARLATGAK